MKTLIDLFNLYGEKDANRDGKLNPEEIPNIFLYDADEDGVLSLWETMEGANRLQRRMIFTERAIKQVQQNVEKGEQFEVILTRDDFVQGIPLQGGTKVSLYSNGRLENGTLSSDITMQEIEFAAGNGIAFHKNGQLKFGTLSKNTVVNGITWSGDAPISFNQSGLFEDGRLAEETIIQGIPLQIGEVIFYNGRLSSGFLARDVEIDGIKWQKQKQIRFHESGRVSHGCLADDTAINGINLKSGTYVNLSPEGRIQEIYSNSDVLLQGVWLRPQSSLDNAFSGYHMYIIERGENGRKLYRILDGIEFYFNGNVRSAELAKDTALQGMMFKAETAIYFYPDGKVKRGTLSTDTVLQGVPFKGNTDIEFDNEGKIITAVVPTGTTIHEVVYPGSAEVRFDEYGDIEYVKMPKWNTATFLGIEFPPKTALELRSGGKSLDSADLVEDCYIHGIPLTAGTHVEFSANGKIEKTLFNGSDINLIQEIVFPKGSEVEFDYDGRITRARFPDNIAIQGISFKKKEVVGGDVDLGFDKEGRVVRVYSECIVQGIVLPGNTALKFDSAGRLAAVSLGEGGPVLGIDFPEETVVLLDRRNLGGAIFYSDTTWNEIPIRYGTKVTFHSNKGLKAMTLVEDTMIQGVPFKGGTEVWFYEDGRLKRGILAEDTVIQEKNFHTGSVLRFDRKGRVDARRR